MLFADFNNKHLTSQQRAQYIGVLGERHARKYLKHKGWRCIGKNIRFGNDELDILAVSPDQRTLAIVEVRSTAQVNKLPETTVGNSKRKALVRMAKQLRGKAAHANCVVRVDLITVRFVGGATKVEHFKGILPLEKSRSFS